jgi:hypothetical protein
VFISRKQMLHNIHLEIDISNHYLNYITFFTIWVIFPTLIWSPWPKLYLCNRSWCRPRNSACTCRIAVPRGRAGTRKARPSFDPWGCSQAWRGRTGLGGGLAAPTGQPRTDWGSTIASIRWSAEKINVNVELGANQFWGAFVRYEGKWLPRVK